MHRYRKESLQFGYATPGKRFRFGPECIDDYAIGSGGGKGMIVDKFLTAVRAEVLYSGYQKVWRIR